MEANKKSDNPKAFPTASALRFQEGMTLRDYFANSAMLGILNNGLKINDSDKTIETYEAVAFNAYLLADAMLKVRQETES